MKKIVVTTIESFHKVLDCLNSRLNDHDGLNRNENILEHSKFEPNFSKRNTSFCCCYGNQNGQKRTRHDRNQSKKVRDRFNEKTVQRQNSVYLRIVIQYSRLKKFQNLYIPVVHIPGTDMGIVDYLSREPNGEPWPESELDEKIVVTTIESFHKVLDCLNSQLNDHDGLNRMKTF